MKSNIVYRNRHIKTDDIVMIKNLIANNPGKSRWFISKELCRQWNWRQPNGTIKDMICRGLLLKLERDGLITLPPRKTTPNNPFLNRKPPIPVKVDQTPIEGNLKDMKQFIELHSVRRTKLEKIYNSLINEYHYLGYTQPVGENLKYIATFKQRPVACIGWSSPAWYIGCRDRFIGWSSEIRKKNLHLIAYQTRFLILPWVRIKCLASYLLGLNARSISADWMKFYNHPIYFLETFVDNERGFRGICYKAANWIYLGETTGRGKLAPNKMKNRSIKAIFGYPLQRDFREILCSLQEK